eukprot:TRINITY_DN38542_c0_g1_i1.p1 TRINITY_DN38542_c0_g1~~TRINITY_DN38542_c0_g1_i1.p1  ORF type:complete len:532 (-),score=141.20 TRINITY_DN38542_c0_g1_i1:161-1756(-)
MAEAAVETKKRFRFSLFSKKSASSVVASLKVLFEQVYGISCGSYFQVDDAVVVAAAADVVPEAETTETEFKVHDVKHGAGAGYSGSANETKLKDMKSKHQKRIAKDKEFASLFNDLGSCGDLVADSDVNYIVVCLLREASFAEMTEQRSKLFTAMMQLLNAFAANEELRKMLTPPNSNGNVLELLRRKKEEAMTYIKCAQDEAANAIKLSNAIDQVLQSAAGVTSNQGDEAKTDDSTTPATADSNEVKDDGGATAGKLPSVDEIRSWLASKKFSFASGIAASSSLKGFDKGGSTKKQKLQRMKKEISILSNSLPDGIFVKVDDERFDFMQVMIIGPQGTPYENGCFMFDLYLPADFPTACPKMNFLTTGGGTFYFNPNLYQSGKVCLSLLGTWQGPGWNADTSTLLQLLVSLQALVFVDFPLENEPGHEGRAHEVDSLAYNKGIRHATVLYAMTWHFTNPSQSVHFLQEAKLHLFANKEVLVKQFEGWEEKNSQAQNFCSYHSWMFNTTFSEMAADLMKQLESFPQGVKLE